MVVCQHEQPRRMFRRTLNGVAKEIGFEKDGDAKQHWHFDDKDEHIQTVPFLWVGTIYFFQVMRPAAAAVKKLREKPPAKKANRAKGFAYLDTMRGETCYRGDL